MDNTKRLKPQNKDNLKKIKCQNLEMPSRHGEEYQTISKACSSEVSDSTMVSIPIFETNSLPNLLEEETDVFGSTDTKLISKKSEKSSFRNYKGIYLENFLLVLRAVLSNPYDMKLFSENDVSVLNIFYDLTLPAQKLYVRLFQRKLKWNRVSKIIYEDICDNKDTGKYVRELSIVNYILKEKEENDLSNMLQLLTCEELKGLCKDLEIATSSKGPMMRALLKRSKQQSPLNNEIPGIDDSVSKKVRAITGGICLINKDVQDIFIRVFMLYGPPSFSDEEIRHFSLKSLLMVDKRMSQINFPSYEIIRQHTVYQSRDDVIRYVTSCQLLINLNECIENQKWKEALSFCNTARKEYEEMISNEDIMNHDMSLPSFLRQYTAISALVYAINSSVEYFQHMKQYNKAVKTLEFLLNQQTHLQDLRGWWYDRLALNLEVHLKLPKVLQVIEEALKDSEVREGHRLSLSLRAEKMKVSARFKSLVPAIEQLPIMKPREAPSVVIKGHYLPGYSGHKSTFICEDYHQKKFKGSSCSVEDFAINYYKGLGYTKGLHREGMTANSLFGLFFWDIIYSPVPDAFHSHHQSKPLDLDYPHFYSARKKVIDNRLIQMSEWTEAKALEEVERIWKNHGAKSIIAWNIFHDLHHAKGLIASLSLPLLASICRRLATDHRFTRSGFPDLIVWDPARKIHRIVEVKGPKDRLSTKQILWLDYLLENGAVTEVCHVEAREVKAAKSSPTRRISPRTIAKQLL